MRKYRRHIKELKKLEQRLTNRNKKKIKKLFLEFKEKIEKDNSEKQFAEEAKVVVKIDYKWFSKRTRNMLEAIYLYNFDEIIDTFKNIYKTKLTEKVIKGIKDKILEQWNKKHAANKVEKITETTRKKLNTIISEGQKIGISHQEMVENIMNAVDDMSEYRASTIARTETKTSINTTSYDGAKKIGMEEKCWIHIGGKKTSRENHKILKNKWIDIDDYYDLGNGIKALYPHEAGLPASEVVNCRCLIIFRLKID